MATKHTVGSFLFDYISGLGVKVAFGIPGDFALPVFAALERSPIEAVTMCHEPGAGFAADAYARINGLGLVCVTYCVGGLNVLNSIAGAYAEKSPVIVVSGAPGVHDRELDPLLHHRVKTFDTQRRVFSEVTCAETVLLDPKSAASEIVRVVDSCAMTKRPVYIEVPYDIVDKPIPPYKHPRVAKRTSDPESLREALDETVEMLQAARKPVILAGVELHRYRLQDRLLAIAERFNIPMAATLLGKSVIRENHPLYVGVYGGAMSVGAARAYVESADCVLMLGAFITDINFGINTAKLSRGNTISVTSESLSVRFHNYQHVVFEDYLRGLFRRKLRPKKFEPPASTTARRPLVRQNRADPIQIVDVFDILACYIDDHSVVVSDVGDAIFGAIGLPTTRRSEFIAPAYYLSMGFGVPAAIGVQMANRKLRPFVLVGDGAFQMTGIELSTAGRIGLAPVVIILNNDGYGTMRFIRDGKFNVITQWQYGKICEMIGAGRADVVSTKGEFDGALRKAISSDNIAVIDVLLPRDDKSPALSALSDELAKRRNPTSARKRKK